MTWVFVYLMMHRGRSNDNKSTNTVHFFRGLVFDRMSVSELADIAATHAYFYQQCALEKIRASVFQFQFLSVFSFLTKPLSAKCEVFKGGVCL